MLSSDSLQHLTMTPQLQALYKLSDVDGVAVTLWNFDWDVVCSDGGYTD